MRISFDCIADALSCGKMQRFRELVSKYEVVMFKAAFALAFTTFLRVGEITVTQYRNDQNTLKYSDLR